MRRYGKRLTMFRHSGPGHLLEHFHHRTSLLTVVSWLCLSMSTPAALIHYWQFDEGSGGSTADSAGGLSGALIGAPLWSNGISNSAVQYNGSNQYVQVSASRIVDALSNYTIETWVYWDTGGNDFQDIYCESQGSWDKVSLAIQGGIVKFFVYTQSGATWRTAAAPTPLPASQWHHLAAVVQSGVGGILYVDGAACATNADIGVAASFRPASLVAIGSGYAGSSRQYFKGKIDEVKIYDHALDAAQVSADFHAMDSVRLKGTTSIEITSLDANGQLTWTNSAALSNGLFSVEWAPDPTGGWNRSWGRLRAMVGSQQSSTVDVPMFFRVKAEPHLFFPLPIDGLLTYAVSDEIGNTSTQYMAVLDYIQPLGSSNEFATIEQAGAAAGIFAMRSTDEAVYRYMPGLGESLEFQIGPVGTTWTNLNYEGNGWTRTTTIEVVEEVTVPAGTYSCYKYHKQVLEEPGSDWYEWVCPGIGLVKWEDHWVEPAMNPPISYELQARGFVGQ